MLKLNRSQWLVFMPAILIVALGAVGVVVASQTKKTEPVTTTTGQAASPEQALPETLESQELEELGDKVIAKVGDEDIYGRDLAFYLAIYSPTTTTADEPITQTILRETLNRIAKDSRTLQGAAAANLVQLEDSFFTGSNKNNEARLESAQAMIGEVNRNLINKTSGETLSIWFNTPTVQNSIGVEAAKATAQEKIDHLEEGLKSGVYISFAEAAEAIKNDESLAELDPAYQSNAYSTFKNVTSGEDFLSDAKVAAAFDKLQAGETSEILTFHNAAGEEHSFMIIRVSDKKDRGFASFADWLKVQEENFPLEIYPF